MNQTVKSFIEKHQLICENDHILVAVSGGPDSMALIHYLHKEHKKNMKLSVAHVEHGLRGKPSLEDLEFVKSYCEKEGIPFYFHQPDVKSIKKEHNFSTQEAARFCRYTWFEKLMGDIRATKLAMAHHGDDQIETVLMRQVRGSVSSLKGIPVKRVFSSGEIIRPLLCLNKDEILTYCEKNNIIFRVDETNETNTYKRNRFRSSILPFLKKENPQVHRTFQRQSEWFKEEDDLLHSLAEERIKDLITKKVKDCITLHINPFISMARPLQRRGVHLILNYLSVDASRYITADHIDDIVTLMSKGFPSGSLHLPNDIIVEKSYNECLFFINTHNEVYNPISIREIPFSGMVNLKKGKIKATIANEWEGSNHNNAVFLADIEKLSTPLFVRSRENGDKMKPLGLKGTKKIKDIFMDAKIPIREREEWPIVVDNRGEIIWIPFLKRYNEALVDEETDRILILQYNHNE
ncbi:tRNA lysidine(34) synthetase TilS [Evansella sp. AB-P1]|uniref:tRNA lysidine(34) synthetase TilS n=1 Tax=Evansella sp. AB-P1 TaxID=3037653 RepID=UPI00241F7727|nr:tRNA lysidine(34) synthetase TilS [Evansella sp. AB-P1]MDG5789999.1 tRNA lysidine(34) synthetase TilS [Evansella sp. AB-P1]